MLVPDAAPPNPPPPDRPRWRDVWQLPALVLGGVLLVGGLTTAYLKAPKADMAAGLADAQKLMESGEYPQALAVLNGNVLEAMNKNALGPQQQREFHLLRARCLYLGQQEKGLDRPENHRAIVSEYLEAERLNAQLDPKDTQYLCATLLSLGEVDRAVRRAQGLPESEAIARRDIIKRAIDQVLSAPKPDTAAALDLLAYLTSDEKLGVPDRAWALARQGRVLIAQGYAPEAAMKIVKTLPRLDGADGPTLGEIHFTLAQAYEQQNELDEAARELEHAATLLEHGSPLMPALALMQAQVFHRRPALGNARERYAAVIQKYPFAPEFGGALLGMAELEAESVISPARPPGEPEDAGSETGGSEDALARSLEHYTKLVELVRSGAAVSATPERIGQSLLTRFREQHEGRKPDEALALRFAALGEQLFGIDKTPPDLVQALAQVHRRLAEEILSAAGGHGGILSLADADPATQREAREHLIRAGEYYRTHAAKTVSNPSLYGESLWLAADCFDRAGDNDAAVGAFQQFAGDFPNDVRQPEALFRLGQCYQSRGDLELAARLYRQLIAGRATGERAGPFADASYVPLAQTLLSDADAANDAEGEELLLTVVNGSIGGTRTPAFRTGLRELGQRYYQTGKHERAIERFEELLTRTAQEPTGAREAELDTVRYRLADCYRLSAATLASDLAAGAMPEGERRDKEKARDGRLSAAATGFEQVRSVLEAKPHRTALEDVYLRNAYFYLGACAFDLKDYTAAVARYDAARERYPKDPASLVAMVQVVSAYLAQGDTAKAALANERAQRFFESIPARAWDDPNLPMSKQDWQQWLAAKEDLKKSAKGGATASATPD